MRDYKRKYDGLRRKSKPCKHSDSCFTCPLPDCRCSFPLTTNEILLDSDFDNIRRGPKENEMPGSGIGVHISSYSFKGKL